MKMKQCDDITVDYEHEDGSNQAALDECIPEEQWYGQTVWSGERLVSPKEWELMQKENIKEQGSKNESL